MLSDFLNSDMSSVDPQLRERVAYILKSRAELMRALTELTELRARMWAGETGLEGIIDLKTADLAKMREDFGKGAIGLIQESIDVDGIVSLLPVFGLALLRNFKVPIPVILEIIGLDTNQVKQISKTLKEFVDKV